MVSRANARPIATVSGRDQVRESHWLRTSPSPRQDRTNYICPYIKCAERYGTGTTLFVNTDKVVCLWLVFTQGSHSGVMGRK